VSRPHCHFLFPGALDTRTGGFIYDRRVIEGLRALGWTVQDASLGEGYPFPADAARRQAQAVIEALPDDSLAVADGLAFGALGALAQAHAGRLRWVALVHHPLALETGLDEAGRQTLHAGETLALAAARGVIVTSPGTVQDLACHGVAPGDIQVVLPGTDPAPPADGSAAGAPLQLLCVASLTPRKGHLALVQALAGLKDHRWQLRCAGSDRFDPDCAAQVRSAIDAHGLADRILLAGEQDEAGLARLYGGADAFVLASFHEGYGMALAEALARGLPVISTRAGAIPGTVPPDAGELVPPGDVDALRSALRRLMEDAAWRTQLRQGARRARALLPDWPASSAGFARALQAFGARRQPLGQGRELP